MAEFEEACVLLSRHTNSPLSPKDVRHMARNLDLNNDGQIDFNEFLEAFRIVDQFGRELERRKSEEKDAAERRETQKNWESTTSIELAKTLIPSRPHLRTTWC